MATKTMAKKLKGSGKKKQYNKSNRTRCSPSDVAKLLEKLSSEQKEVVRDMGFGALENLSILNISKKMMMELVDSFNTNDNNMRTTLGRIKLDASKIGDALGLNARGNTYEKKMDNKKLSDEQKAAVNSFKGVTILSLKRTIIETTVDSEENTRKFKRAFILFIQKTFLCATNSNPLSPKHFPAIVNVDNLRQMNWARHTHFGEYSEDDEARPPWISYWRGDRLKERLKLEKKDSTPAKNADATVDPPSQGVAAIDDVLLTPPDCGIEIVEATSAEEELISRELSESTTHLVVETNVEKGDIAEKESVIEVVEATSAEDELIRRELSESIANLVVETNVKKGDIAEKEEPKENVETDKEVHEEINRNIMMIAKMAVAQGDMGPLPSFDLGIDFGSQSQSQSQPEKEKEPAQETEKHDQDVQKQKGKEIQQHQGPEIKTPEEAIQKRQSMRYHFTSMAEDAEMDLAHNIFEKNGPDYIDTKTGLPYKIETMPNLDALDYIDENKIKSSPFLFAPILYSHHWWLYVLDVTNKKFYILDSKNGEPRRGDRNKLNRFASNVLDQMRGRAGAETMFPRMTRNMVTHYLFPKYIRVPKQPNAFDCGVYVLKYMDIVNPSLLEKKNFTAPVWAELAENFVQTTMHNRCPSLAFLSDLTSFEATRQSGVVSLSPFVQNRLVVAAADVAVIPSDVLAPASQYISWINLIRSLITQHYQRIAA
ncbi:hypothetical protein PIB30_085081 [Stylosanthes scabra]|uniref:Ubiquitin-like protease family profile domain-containing protein n=1 Tax=Stylosanthes scabra TaxID=79078 RepID=A0ABU6URL6_9FABA|nr:hypothetical protein [Stylosanthes scabra]